MSLLQIYYRVGYWKIFENRIIVSEVMAKSLVSFFWLTVYILIKHIFNRLQFYGFYVTLTVAIETTISDLCEAPGLPSSRNIVRIKNQWSNYNPRNDIGVWSELVNCRNIDNLDSKWKSKRRYMKDGRLCEPYYSTAKTVTNSVFKTTWKRSWRPTHHHGSKNINKPQLNEGRIPMLSDDLKRWPKL